MRPRHVVAAVAVGPEESEDAAARVVDEAAAQAAGGRLTLVHVDVPPLPPVSPASFEAPLLTAYAIDAARVDQRSRADERLAALARRASAGGCAVDTQVIEAPGPVGETIVAVAAAADADLIVVGTHGRRGVRRWLLGSVADAVARRARVPVLVVPPDGDRAAAHDDDALARFVELS